MYNLKSSFNSFLEYLNDNRERISYLQLTGKIEDYLVKEFCYLIYDKSKGENAAVINLGSSKKKEKVVDICIIAGKNLNYIEIVEMIEVKYFRNWHRFRPYDAKDNIRTLMKGFNKQIYSIEKEKHGWFKINSNVKRVKAIAFASFVSYEESDNKKEDYYTRILNVAKVEFADNIISRFNLQKVYEDMEVILFNKKIYVTLRSGIWE